MCSAIFYLPENADPTGYIGFYGQKAATLSIMDFYGNEIYSDQIKYGINTFEVNYALNKINGFETDIFVNGTDMNLLGQVRSGSTQMAFFF
jgi:hypothetical protein